MLQSAWLFIGVLGIITTCAAVVTDDDGVAIVAGVLGFVLWGIWTYGSLNVQIQEGGATTAYTMPELAIIGVGLAMIPGFIALTGPVEIISRATDADLRDL